MTTDRTVDRHLRNLLVLYVLDAIGHVPEHTRGALMKLGPQLCATWGVAGPTWKEALAQAMHFPPTLPTRFQEMWQRELDAAKTTGIEPVAQVFAEAVVDRNFGGT